MLRLNLYLFLVKFIEKSNYFNNCSNNLINNLISLPMLKYKSEKVFEIKKNTK